MVNAVAHGRTAFDTAQGACIDHDGIHTLWQLLQRTNVSDRGPQQ